MPRTAGLHSLTTNLDHPGHYLHWGVVQISVANLTVIVLMLVLFALAVLLPFPRGGAVEERRPDDDNG